MIPFRSLGSDTLQRATSVIQKETAKKPAFMQKTNDSHNRQSVVEIFTAVIDAAAPPSVDKQKPVTLKQSRHERR